MNNPAFYHDKPLTESELYRKASESFLFPDLGAKEAVRRPMGEIDPALVRDPIDDQQATRLIMVDTATLTVREAYDFERLDSKFNVDLVLKQFGDTDLSAILAVQSFDLFDQIGDIVEVDASEKITIDGLGADLHCALIAIGFNDPLDILLYLTTKDDIKYCQVMAVTPRPNH